MIENRTLYLHLGAPKAASTTLQERVFPKFSDLIYVNKPRFGLVEGRYVGDGELARMLLHSSRIWNEFGEDFFGRLRDLLRESGLPIKDVLISDENMSVNRSIDPAHLGSHLRQIRKLALAHGFSELRLILIIRRQDEWLASAYAQTSDRIPRACQRHFEDWFSSKIENRQGFYTRGFELDYLANYEEMIAVVGPENILFLPMEMATASPHDFALALCEFVRAPGSFMVTEVADILAFKENIRARNTALTSGPKQWMLRPKNRIMRWRKTYITMTKKMSDVTLNRYSHSNQKLSKVIGRDLGQFGYY